MMKRLWFQLHWFFGITAGLVLAVVGLTGALLSYDDELTRALSPGVMTVPVRDTAPLPVAELVARVHEAAPERRILLMTLTRSPEDAVGVRLSTGDGPRGETYFVDPYTGQMLGRSKADVVFRFIMDVHRFLTIDGIGKQITAAATLLLFLLALSGLYLRWPRRVGNWRAWLHIDVKKRGRPFLWNLHAVIGTVVLVPYLLSAVTGLYWSYDWWRGMLFTIAGVEQPVRNRPAQAPKGGKNGARDEGRKAVLSDLGSTSIGDMRVVWDSFSARVPNYTKVYLRPSQKPGGPLQVTWLDDTAPHERAFSRMDVVPASGEIRNEERYGEKTLGARLMTSIYALHRGSFFGQAGIIIMMLSSLMMPVFFVTGWMLYLDRRKKKRALAASRVAGADHGANTAAGALTDDGVLIGYASQSGVAEGLAWQTAGMLQGAGVPAQIQPLARIGEAQLGRARRALFIVSTFGDGEPPDSARRFAQQLMNQAMALPGLRFAMLSLGDSHYERFCGFGRKLDGWLRAQGGVAAFEPIEVDRGDPGAWARWQERLGEWLGRPLGPLGPLGSVGPVSAPVAAKQGAAPAFAPWKLVERLELNPGSAGLPAYHLAFTPPPGATWVAGDLVEVRPSHTAARVEAFLSGSVWAPDVRVSVAGHALTLGEALRERVLPDAAPPAGVDLQDWLEHLAPLPEREYSIASTPAEGKLMLLVRQARRPDGSLGLGSGWLTDGAALGEGVTMRVRPNPGFHGPDDARGMILIGNGTGLAGLRAHLAARIAQGRVRNWLIFGERQAAHDSFHDATLREWLAEGGIARLDRVYSRDQVQRVYVQDKVRESARDIAAWVAQGASIYVCGSLAGMAPAVDAALAEALGAEVLLDLSAQGRYRRDIY
ncbi:PepSY domain-containing protein [Pandoraea nosoerga]|uniref:Flavodoxin n=1 Tax=Pandoraea nosoerga TaxID=2508296 RepID=A0A5E4SII8_9BURK|nr:PepSY domain-containing protein [Pandoraea nosoerga]VVD74048.1 flavodoxin [Pandoraea nosoerga]